MKPHASYNAAAFPVIAMEILNNVLSRADNPGDLGTYLTGEVRDLTDARCVLLIQCLCTATVAAHRVVSVNPPQRREWAESLAGNLLYEAVHLVPAPQQWRGKGPSEIEGLLRDEGFELSMAFPLNVGEFRVGAMLVLGLSGEEPVTSAFSLLNNLSAIMALVLRNAILYEKQEQLIEERTAELWENNEKLSMELTERKRAEEEIGARKQVEEELRQFQDELEKRVVERTTELKSQRVNQEEMIRQRTAELQERSRELQDNQQALMNIVDDLSQKTDELEKANAKLQDLDRLKSMFIASMSHELRTPLNSIIGFSSIIHDEWLGPVNPEQKENLDTIKRSGKHLLSLINDVIDVSKIEAGRIETRLEEFDLYDLLTEAVQYVEKDLSDKGLELHLDIHHHTIYTDKRRLLQCVINLLSNAVKFTERGKITLLSTVADIEQGSGGQRPSLSASEQIDISVADSGIGIATEDIPRLFQPFERLESSLKSTAPGTGLGLYLTRKLVVEVLRGDIICKSDAGIGSTFTLRIPERIYEKCIGS